jgi:uncharacterized membrane protein affecting hemolysin expression
VVHTIIRDACIFVAKGENNKHYTGKFKQQVVEGMKINNLGYIRLQLDYEKVWTTNQVSPKLA